MNSTIWVSNSVEIAYSDTGAPSIRDYTTIFAIHGLAFGGFIFRRLAQQMFAENVRFVSVARRNYRGSTPYTKEELRVINNGTEEEKTNFSLSQSQEIAQFITIFIEQFKLPPVSTNGTGGVGVLGWSLGTVFALGVTASVPSLPINERYIFQRHLRSLILLDPAPNTLGLPSAPKDWMPFRDPTIPSDEALAVFAPWVTSYFDHKNIEGREFGALTYVAPSLNRLPAIYNMTSAERGIIIEADSAAPDGNIVSNFQPQILADFRASLFDPALRAFVPHMKVTHIFGTSSAAFSVAAWWAVEAEDKTHGGGFVSFEPILGANHLMPWDEPEKTSKAILAGFGIKNEPLM